MQQHNCCVFPKIIDGQMPNSAEKCGLYFRTLPELIHHIEEEHIPIIDFNRKAELKQMREQFGNDPENYEKAYAAFLSQPVPLSLISKLKPFPKGHKVHPIPPPKPRTLKFSHYKPKAPPLQQHTQTEVALHMKELDQISGVEIVDSLDRQPPKKTHASDTKFRHGSASLSKSATPELINGQSTAQDASKKILKTTTGSGMEEKKHRCPVETCNKTYKNQQGLKQHLRVTHSSVDPIQLMATKLSASEEGILSRQLPGRQSPLVRSDSTKPMQEATLGTIVSQTGISTSTRYKCQQCGKEFKGLKGFSNLNKHLFDAHQIVIAQPSPSVHSSRYPSPSPLSNVQSVYSPQQSPQRPISNGNAMAVLSAPKSNDQFQQYLSQNAFIAPTLTPRHHQQTSLNQTARPSAPIPPSTPPSTGMLSQQSVGYSPQHYPQQSIRTQGLDIQPRFIDQQEQIQPQQQYFLATHAQSPLSNEQQPPVLQPQQQPTPQNTQRRFYSYQQQQPQFIQQRQVDQQQTPQYSPAHAHTYAYSSSQQPQLGTTTILLASGSNLGTTGPQTGQHQAGYGIQQMEYETHHENYSRPYYRQQPHYMVEQIHGQQQQPLYAQQLPQQLQTSNARMTQGNVRLSSQPYIQQEGVTIPQQQAQYQPVFAQPQPGQQRQPYMAATIRTTPIQVPQRTYQQQQFYPSQQRPGNSQRQSPATVAAVLAATSPQQGGASPSVYTLQQQTQQPIGGFVQQQQ